jgi:hypothetical protein
LLLCSKTDLTSKNRRLFRDRLFSFLVLDAWDQCLGLLLTLKHSFISFLFFLTHVCLIRNY